MPSSDISTIVPVENGIGLINFIRVDPETTRADNSNIGRPVTRNPVEDKPIVAKSNTDRYSTDVVISNECLETDEDISDDRGPCVQWVERIETAASQCFIRFKYIITYGIKLLLLVLYGVYFAYCMYYRFGDEGSIVLLIGTTFFVIYLCSKVLRYGGYTCSLPSCLATCASSTRGKRIRRFIRYGLYAIATVGLCLFLGLDVLRNNPQNSQSILGIVVLILLTLIFSTKPSRVNWHPVFWGFIMQFAFAILTLRTEAGYTAFKWCGDMMQTLVDFSDAGAAFLFSKDYKNLGLAFYAAGIVVFFNGIIFLLNHWGVLEVIILRLGYILSLSLDTGPVESVTAVANIFISLTEAPLLIRPFLPTLSRSELCAVMTCGFASIAGGIMGLFIQIGAPANHLLTAAVISAPAGLALSKVVCPETERVNYAAQRNMKIRDDSDKSQSSISAFVNGSVMGVKIIVPALANLMAFISMISLIDALLGWFGERAGVSGLTFQLICSYILYPLVYVMGVPPADCRRAASLIGAKLFTTPLVGYSELGNLIRNRGIFENYISTGHGSWHWSGDHIILDASNTTLFNGFMTERSEMIITYAMCGFSSFPTIGITIGTMASLAPSRKQDVMELVLLAFFAGNLASFATGAVAGVMYTPFSNSVPSHI